jgi:hypothetical protein
MEGRVNPPAAGVEPGFSRITGVMVRPHSRKVLDDHVNSSVRKAQRSATRTKIYSNRTATKLPMAKVYVDLIETNKKEAIIAVVANYTNVNTRLYIYS